MTKHRKKQRTRGVALSREAIDRLHQSPAWQYDPRPQAVSEGTGTAGRKRFLARGQAQVEMATASGNKICWYDGSEDGSMWLR